ncbi:MAG: GxxExxY protein [Gemmatimonadaceae bacterium]|nr:GxxExxY protein [Gemmatimonadaceae bacterium]
MSEPMLFEEVTHEIIGAFYDVYNAIPYEQHESVYAAAMVIALGDRHLTVRREVPYPLHFRGVRIGEIRPDLIVNGQVVVELKAAERIIPAHEKQLYGYLQVTRLSVGLLLNFGPKADRRRLTCTKSGAKLTDG